MWTRRVPATENASSGPSVRLSPPFALAPFHLKQAAAMQMICCRALALFPSPRAAGAMQEPRQCAWRRPWNGISLKIGPNHEQPIYDTAKDLCSC